MIQLWARAVRRHRTVRSETVAYEGDFVQALGEVLEKMDLPRPLVLGKHEREWEQFGLTSFGKDHFVEGIGYDKIEVELIDTQAKRERNRDPRNG